MKTLLVSSAHSDLEWTFEHDEHEPRHFVRHVYGDEQTDETIGFAIPEERLPDLEKRVAKLNRRSAKLGGSPEAISIVKLGEVWRHEKEAVRAGRDGWRYERTGRADRAVLVRLEGTAPVVDGFRFLARLEHLKAGNVVTTLETTSVPAHWRSAPGHCEHCRTKRARRDTFVLEATRDTDTRAGLVRQGEQIQIGRNCFADFLREGDPTIAIGLLSYTAKLATDLGIASCEEEQGWPRGPVYVAVEEIVQHAFAAVRVCGWVSAGEASDDETKCSTRQRVSFSMGSAPLSSRKLADFWRELQPVAEDAEKATAALAWIRELPESERKSDYLHNLWLLANEQRMRADGRHLGLVVSLARAYASKLEREHAQRTRREAAMNSTHFGRVGARYWLGECTVQLTREMANDYGLTTLVCFTDKAGHRFKWWCSGRFGYAMGDVVSVVATVKAHDTYKDIRETIVLRCDVGTEEIRTTKIIRTTCEKCGYLGGTLKGRREHEQSECQRFPAEEKKVTKKRRDTARQGVLGAVNNLAHGLLQLHAKAPWFPSVAASFHRAEKSLDVALTELSQ